MGEGRGGTDDAEGGGRKGSEKTSVEAADDLNEKDQDTDLSRAVGLRQGDPKEGGLPPDLASEEGIQSEEAGDEQGGVGDDRQPLPIHPARGLEGSARHSQDRSVVIASSVARRDKERQGRSLPMSTSPTPVEGALDLLRDTLGAMTPSTARVLASDRLLLGGETDDHNRSAENDA